mgnify:CR=1 FL=1
MNALTHSFDPAQDNSREFRAALGRFGTGVTVITCDAGDGPLGITANSFASVSLDPPLVLWSPAKSSSRYPFFMAADHFAIHVVGAEQADLCTAFARNGNPFDDFDWEMGDHNVPLLNNCLSRFECTKVAEHDGGDHSIVVGEVLGFRSREGKGLLFGRGGYGWMAPPP